MKHRAVTEQHPPDMLQFCERLTVAPMEHDDTLISGAAHPTLNISATLSSGEW